MLIVSSSQEPCSKSVTTFYPNPNHVITVITTDTFYIQGSRRQLSNIYTPIKSEREREGGRERGQADQQGAFDTKTDLCWCQCVGIQTRSQLWFVLMSLLTLFDLGLGRLNAQATIVPFKTSVKYPFVWVASEFDNAPMHRRLNLTRSRSSNISAPIEFNADGFLNLP